MATANGSLYDRLVAVTSDLLGPASERFIDRQIANHLKKDPVDLTPKDIDVLAEWIRLSMGLLTNDLQTLKEYNQALRELGEG